jgi:DNA-binding CsgD family transcriptional regulator
VIREVAGIHKIRMTYLQLLYRCNFECQHCFHGERLQHRDAFSADEAIRFLRLMREEYAAEAVTFLGGEPFLYHDLPEVVRGAKRQLGLRVEICSNGYRIERRMAEIAADLDFLRISLEGTSATNDRIRRRGSYEAALSTLRCGAELRIPTGATMTVTARVPGLAIAVSAHGRAGRLAAMDAAFDELSSAPRAGGIGTVVDAAAAERAEAHGDFDATRRLWEDAIDGSLGLGMRFEAAHARAGVARALIGLGRTDEAAIQSSRVAAELAELRGRAQAGMLTSRERQVLELVAEGLTDDEIAGRLLLSRHTVHRHVANVRTKLGQPSRAAAVAEATRRSLI